MTYQFTVEFAGKIYQCESIVSGKGDLKQIINVDGIGSVKDSAVYGASKHSASTMKAAGRQIAREIIEALTV